MELNPVTIVRESGPDSWVTEDLPLKEALQLTPDPSSAVVIFTTAKALLSAHISAPLPEEFIQVISTGSLGSFYCDYETEGGQHLHTSWACYDIKSAETSYSTSWVQPSMLAEWNGLTKQQKVIFVDVPQVARMRLLSAFPSSQARSCCPFVWHTAFARPLVGLYREAIWTEGSLAQLREKSKTDWQRVWSLGLDPQHHVLDMINGTEVAMHTLQCILDEQSRFQERFPSVAGNDSAVYLKNQQKLLFLSKEMYALKTRAHSMSQRIQNKINLTLFRESGSMSAIALATLPALPLNFLAAVFGMNFFDFSGDSGSWIVSSKIWVFWEVALPLTLLLFFVWFYSMKIAHLRIWGSKRYQYI